MIIRTAIGGAVLLVALTSEAAAYGATIEGILSSRLISSEGLARDGVGVSESLGIPAPAGQTGEAAHAKSTHANMEPTLISSPAAWFGPDNYPKPALRANRQGRVVAAIKVDARGVATSCSIEVSSGTTSLDEATCNNAMAHAAFDPATDGNGKRVEGIYHMSVRWALPEPQVKVVDLSRGEPEETLIDYEIKVDADGRAISCTPTATRIITEVPVPCGQFTPGAQTPFRWKRKGRPVGARLIYHTTLRVAADQ